MNPIDLAKIESEFNFTTPSRRVLDLDLGKEHFAEVHETLTGPKAYIALFCEDGMINALGRKAYPDLESLRKDAPQELASLVSRYNMSRWGVQNPELHQDGGREIEMSGEDMEQDIAF
jgi:hypothetical protein